MARRCRVDEDLTCHRRIPGVTQAQRNGGRQVAAGALAGDNHRGRSEIEARRILERPTRHPLTVVQPGRIRVLRRKAKLDRYDDGTRCVRELAGNVVHDADAADDEGATVEIHHGYALLTGYAMVGKLCQHLLHGRLGGQQVKSDQRLIARILVDQTGIDGALRQTFVVRVG